MGEEKELRSNVIVKYYRFVKGVSKGLGSPTSKAVMHIQGHQVMFHLLLIDKLPDLSRT